MNETEHKRPPPLIDGSWQLSAHARVICSLSRIASRTIPNAPAFSRTTLVDISIYARVSELPTEHKDIRCGVSVTRISALNKFWFLKTPRPTRPLLMMMPVSETAVTTKPPLSAIAEKELLVDSVTNSNEVIVDWEGPDDPANPLNWTSARKTFIIVMVSAVTFNISLVPTIFAPGVPLLLKEFHSESSALASFVLSAYIVPFAIAPLLLAPLSELYGRNVVMNAANLGFLVFTIVCAVSNSIGLFIAFRVFQGLAGCVPLVLGGGMIGDLMPPEKRGRALSGWQLGPLLVRYPSSSAARKVDCTGISNEFLGTRYWTCDWGVYRSECRMALAILARGNIGLHALLFFSFQC